MGMIPKFNFVTTLPHGISVETREFEDRWETHRVIRSKCTSYTTCYTMEEAMENHRNYVDSISKFLELPLEDLPKMINNPDLFMGAMVRWRLSG